MGGKRIQKVPAKYRKEVEAQVRALIRCIQDSRKKRGYSQAELAEALDVSPMTIQFLEQRRRDPSLPLLFYLCRYLGIELSWRSDTRGAEVIDGDDPRVEKEQYRSLLPLYSFRAAAGRFQQGRNVEKPEGWIEVKGRGRLDTKMFVVQARGDSMEPKIADGDYLVFRFKPEGSRNGKIVLAQFRDSGDTGTQGSFVVKVYKSEKTTGSDGEFSHKEIRLESLNKAYPAIRIPPDRADSFDIVGEYLYSV